MEDKTSNEHWLDELRRAIRIMGAIEESLHALEMKRITLEEKIIRRHLHSIAREYAEIVGSVHQRLSEDETPPPKSLEIWRETDNEVEAGVNDLLKIIKYDPNFLEQYYEYGFMTKLNEEFRWSEKLGRVIDAIQA